MCDTSEKICIGFIGLGLIGGSIAKTLRKVHPEYKLMAYCRTKATIEEAIQEGVIDIALEERDDRFADCDYIFLCSCQHQHLLSSVRKRHRKTGLYHHRRRKCKRRNPSGG